MKRQRSKSPLRLTRDAEKLISLSTGLVASGSRAEDRYWEAAIMALADKMMTGGHDAAIESALDHTFKSNLAAHDVLIELIESGAECAITRNRRQALGRVAAGDSAGRLVQIFACRRAPSQGRDRPHRAASCMATCWPPTRAFA